MEACLGLFREIALARGKQVSTSSILKGGKDLAYHLAQPATEKALSAKVWNWVVLQDFSTRPTQIGNVEQFLRDGNEFSARIDAKSPSSGIVLYETWARPPGDFYVKGPGKALSNPGQMMTELHQSYDRMQIALSAQNPNRPVHVAPVGTAFEHVKSKYPEIHLDADDQHHASAAGYYLAALLIYETIYHESVKGAPTTFYKGALTIPPDEALKLQTIADEVALTSGK